MWVSVLAAYVLKRKEETKRKEISFENRTVDVMDRDILWNLPLGSVVKGLLGENNRSESDTSIM